MLEGGYDLDALADSTAATLAAMLGVDVAPEPRDDRWAGQRQRRGGPASVRARSA